MSDDGFADILERATQQSLRGGLGTLALLLSMACPVLIVYCFNRDGPYYTAHHANAEVVTIWDPWRQPEPWHEDGLLRCTWLDEANQTWDALNSTAITLMWDDLNSTATTEMNSTNQTCPALKRTGTTEDSLTAMQITALYVYPVAAAARPVVLGCAFAGVLKESWLYLLQAAVGMCSTFALAVLFELAQPMLEGGDDASGWVVVCALPSVVWLAVRVEFVFCWAQVCQTADFIPCHLPLGALGFMIVMWLAFVSPNLHGVYALIKGVPYGWMYFTSLPCLLLAKYFTERSETSVPSPRAAIVIILLEFAVWTIFYYAFYDSHFGSFVMDTTWVSFSACLRVLFPMSLPLVLLVSLSQSSHGTNAVRVIRPCGYQATRDHGHPAYDLPEEASGYESCPETTAEAAAQCDTADGVELHLRLPNGVLVPVELGSDATLGVLRLRAADALEVDRKQVRVRLALCGETVAGCNATPLCDVPGLEAGATVDVDTDATAQQLASCPHQSMELACQGDDVQAARRVLAISCGVLNTLVSNYARSGCRGVVCCALLEGNLASAAVVVQLLLETEEESALRVIQESGVLDRPDFYDAFCALLVSSSSLSHVESAIRCPGFLESTACDHNYIVFVANCDSLGDYTTRWRRLHEAGWRSTPSAVQQADKSQRSFFQINLLTIMLLLDGVRVRDLPHVVKRLWIMALLYACLACPFIGVHATLGTQGADPTGGWLFVAFLCTASVTIAIELMPEWVRWLVVLKVCGTRTSQPPAGTQDVEHVGELTEMEMPLLNQSSQADTDEALAVGTLLPVRPLPSGA